MVAVVFDQVWEKEGSLRWNACKLQVSYYSHLHTFMLSPLKWSSLARLIIKGKKTIELQELHPFKSVSKNRRFILLFLWRVCKGAKTRRVSALCDIRKV